LGHTQIEIVNADFFEFAKSTEQGSYDLVLLDAPCSNLGVLARKPDVRWWLKSETLESLVALQKNLLDSAKKLVAVNGFLIYSTCTIARAENELQIAQFLRENRDFELVEQKRFLPEIHGRQGAFKAVLKK